MHNRSMFKPRVPKPSDWRRRRSGRRWRLAIFRALVIVVSLAIWALLLFAPQILFHLTLFWLVD